jgi:hypothetical protein
VRDGNARRHECGETGDRENQLAHFSPSDAWSGRSVIGSGVGRAKAV